MFHMHVLNCNSARAIRRSYGSRLALLYPFFLVNHSIKHKAKQNMQNWWRKRRYRKGHWRCSEEFWPALSATEPPVYLTFNFLSLFTQIEWSYGQICMHSGSLKAWTEAMAWCAHRKSDWPQNVSRCLGPGNVQKCSLGSLTGNGIEYNMKTSQDVRKVKQPTNDKIPFVWRLQTPSWPLTYHTP